MTAFEVFYSTFTLDILFSENKRKTVREIRLKYVHRGQTYLKASHSQLRYIVIFISRLARVLFFVTITVPSEVVR